jgi:hypothetical protein
LLPGLEEAFSPENDIAAVAANIHLIRRKMRKKVIDDSKVDF